MVATRVPTLLGLLSLPELPRGQPTCEKFGTTDPANEATCKAQCSIDSKDQMASLVESSRYDTTWYPAYVYNLLAVGTNYAGTTPLPEYLNYVLSRQDLGAERSAPLQGSLMATQFPADGLPSTDFTIVKPYTPMAVASKTGQPPVWVNSPELAWTTRLKPEVLEQNKYTVSSYRGHSILQSVAIFNDQTNDLQGELFMRMNYLRGKDNSLAKSATTSITLAIPITKDQSQGYCNTRLKDWMCALMPGECVESDEHSGAVDLGDTMRIHYVKTPSPLGALAGQCRNGTKFNSLIDRCGTKVTQKTLPQKINTHTECGAACLSSYEDEFDGIDGDCCVGFSFYKMADVEGRCVLYYNGFPNAPGVGPAPPPGSPPVMAETDPQWNNWECYTLESRQDLDEVLAENAVEYLQLCGPPSTKKHRCVSAKRSRIEPTHEVRDCFESFEYLHVIGEGRGKEKGNGNDFPYPAGRRLGENATAQERRLFHEHALKNAKALTFVDDEIRRTHLGAEYSIHISEEDYDYIRQRLPPVQQSKRVSDTTVTVATDRVIVDLYGTGCSEERFCPYLPFEAYVDSMFCVVWLPIAAFVILGFALTFLGLYCCGVRKKKKEITYKAIVVRDGDDVLASQHATSETHAVDPSQLQNHYDCAVQ